MRSLYDFFFLGEGNLSMYVKAPFSVDLFLTSEDKIFWKELKFLHFHDYLSELKKASVSQSTYRCWTRFCDNQIQDSLLIPTVSSDLSQLKLISGDDMVGKEILNTDIVLKKSSWW